MLDQLLGRQLSHEPVRVVVTLWTKYCGSLPREIIDLQ